MPGWRWTISRLAAAREYHSGCLVLSIDRHSPRLKPSSLSMVSIYSANFPVFSIVTWMICMMLAHWAWPPNYLIIKLEIGNENKMETLLHRHRLHPSTPSLVDVFEDLNFNLQSLKPGTTLSLKTKHDRPQYQPPHRKC